MAGTYTEDCLSLSSSFNFGAKETYLVKPFDVYENPTHEAACGMDFGELEDSLREPINALHQSCASFRIKPVWKPYSNYSVTMQTALTLCNDTTLCGRLVPSLKNALCTLNPGRGCKKTLFLRHPASGVVTIHEHPYKTLPRFHLRNMHPILSMIHAKGQPYSFLPQYFKDVLSRIDKLCRSGPAFHSLARFICTPDYLKQKASSRAANLSMALKYKEELDTIVKSNLKLKTVPQPRTRQAELKPRNIIILIEKGIVLIIGSNLHNVHFRLTTTINFQIDHDWDLYRRLSISLAVFRFQHEGNVCPNLLFVGVIVNSDLESDTRGGLRNELRRIGKLSKEAYQYVASLDIEFTTKNLCFIPNQACMEAIFDLFRYNADRSPAMRHRYDSVSSFNNALCILNPSGGCNKTLYLRHPVSGVVTVHEYPYTTLPQIRLRNIHPVMSMLHAKGQSSFVLPSYFKDVLSRMDKLCKSDSAFDSLIRRQPGYRFDQSYFGHKLSDAEKKLSMALRYKEELDTVVMNSNVLRRRRADQQPRPLQPTAFKPWWVTEAQHHVAAVSGCPVLMAEEIKMRSARPEMDLMTATTEGRFFLF
ncbi:hypothetical protein CYLTODRAFT_443212 [Cylindrobasidium torrendii FP15055 ss-10]|uniref:Uncharacterized protein n=1 Tax=Cylindrobasidium torrendii FP15055 ss-10 TaxID=1314674 RepID=A0A0D7BE00_9AGAR|nr:hypothetical protein CYLTODRAFT_443212 [Cylindrobasidium torrendii FP15055 ss-10]